MSQFVGVNFFFDHCIDAKAFFHEFFIAFKGASERVDIEVVRLEYSDTNFLGPTQPTINYSLNVRSNNREFRFYLYAYTDISFNKLFYFEFVSDGKDEYFLFEEDDWTFVYFILKCIIQVTEKIPFTGGFGYWLEWMDMAPIAMNKLYELYLQNELPNQYYILFLPVGNKYAN